MNEREFIPLNLAILTVSDTRTLADDLSGDTLTKHISEAGHLLQARDIVKDDKYAIRAVLSTWIVDNNIDAVITTGGTGLTGRDGTPEAAELLFDKTINGFGELFRQLSYNIIGSSTLQSRATAGVANGTYIFVLPGSKSACSDAWNLILKSQLDYRTKPCNMVELMPRLTEQ